MFFKYREMTTYKLDLLATRRKPDKEMKDKGARLEIYHHPITTDAYGPNKSVFVVYHQKIINCKTKNDFGANCYSYPRFWIDATTGKIINIVEYQRFILSLWEDVLVEYHEVTGQNKIFRENLADWVAQNGRRAHSHKLDYQKSFPKSVVIEVHEPIQVKEVPFPDESTKEVVIEIAEIIEEEAILSEAETQIEIDEVIEPTEFVEVENLEPEIIKGINKNNKPKNVRISKVKLPIKASSGLRNLIKSKGKVAA